MIACCRCGDIFHADFLDKMQQCASRLQLSARVQQLLPVVLEEARCARHLAIDGGKRVDVADLSVPTMFCSPVYLKFNDY